MKAGVLVAALMGLTMAAGSVLADTKPVIGALIRNLDDQFLNDYTANLKKVAASKALGQNGGLNGGQGVIALVRQGLRQRRGQHHVLHVCLSKRGRLFRP